MKHWAGMQERGIVWGMWLLLKVYLTFGRRILQFFLYPVVSYYWLVNSTARRASIDYLQCVSALLPAGAVRTGAWGSYRHFIGFANAIIDKLAAWSGGLTLGDVDYCGREAIARHLEQGQGLLIFGSHLGNMEVSRVIAHLRDHVTVNVLVHTKHAEKFNTLLNRYAGAGRMNLIQVTEITAATAMQLYDKINAGEMVVIAADRTPVGGQGRIAHAQFLGRTAPFPQGPYLLASLLKCPVYTLFCLKRQGRQTIYFERFSEGISIPRKRRDEAIDRYAQEFADRLQRYCLIEPLQWFNFYDFWQEGND
ncbi:MAG: hypothetical protein Kow0065_09680 [Methylomicrobium sp.]